MTDGPTIWRALDAIRKAPEDDQRLARLAARAGLSPSHFHREFRAHAGETPKQASTRLRLVRAALELSTTHRSVLEIALATGFASHEVFTRAFRRQFHVTPSAFRLHRAADNRCLSESDRAAVESIHACINLFGIHLNRSTPLMTEPASIELCDVAAQPILFIRRKFPQAVLQETMAECFGLLYQHGMANGLDIAGHPITRYVDTSIGRWTVDFVMPLNSAAETSGDLQAGEIAACRAVRALHLGPYEKLGESHDAIDAWIEAQGLTADGYPWENYLTDPTEEPDPAKWQTMIFWPLA